MGKRSTWRLKSPHFSPSNSSAIQFLAVLSGAVFCPNTATVLICGDQHWNAAGNESVGLRIFRNLHFVTVSLDGILIADSVSISGADCPLNKNIIDKGPEWSDFDSQPVSSVHFLVVHGLVWFLYLVGSEWWTHRWRIGCLAGFKEQDMQVLIE